MGIIILVFFSGALLCAGLMNGLLGFIITFSLVGLFWLFIYTEVKRYQTKEGRKQIQREIQQQKEYEDEYGIIDTRNNDD